MKKERKEYTEFLKVLSGTMVLMPVGKKRSTQAIIKKNKETSVS